MRVELNVKQLSELLGCDECPDPMPKECNGSGIICKSCGDECWGCARCLIAPIMRAISLMWTFKRLERKA